MYFKRNRDRMENPARTDRRTDGRTDMSNKENNHKVVNVEFIDVSQSPFKELGIEDSVLRALHTLNFTEPTSIQKKVIPLALSGQDIIAGSETGSGKTLAFGAGILHNAKPGMGVQALILTPTRELAEQVARSLRSYAKFKSLRIAAVYGGVSIMAQINELRRADVVVATPGRFLDHIERRTARLDKIRTVVLDEADTMLDMGFSKDVEKILQGCPKDKQTLMFSATITKDVNRLAEKYIRNAVNIQTKTAVDPRKLKQVCYDTPNDLKFSLLVHLLKSEKGALAMTFCNTRRVTDLVVKNLKFAGIEAEAIHGGLSQNERNRAIQKFHSRRVEVLVCTDVAARGLDIKDVSHVYNYDVPIDSAQYTHRIGRTARAGKEGKAVNILLKSDRKRFMQVVNSNSVHVIREKLPSYIERAKTCPN